MKLHENALALAKTYQQTEADLLAVLIAMEKAREFVRLGFTGIFDYVRNALELSEAQAMYFQKVVRASVQVPTLEKAVTSGEISLSQARRIVPVVTEKNAETWIEAAKDLTQRELEAAVASVNPSATKVERIKPVAKETSKLELTLSDEIGRAHV